MLLMSLPWFSAESSAAWASVETASARLATVANSDDLFMGALRLRNIRLRQPRKIPSRRAFANSRKLIALERQNRSTVQQGGNHEGNCICSTFVRVDTRRGERRRATGPVQRRGRHHGPLAHHFQGCGSQQEDLR